MTLFALVLVLALTGLGATGWLVMVYADRAGPGAGRTVSVALRQGDSPREVADRLHALGLVEQPWNWSVYACLLGANGRFREGEVLVHQGMSARALLQRLAEGFGAAEVRVTFPEGYTRFDIAERLERWGIVPRRAFLDATEDRGLLDALGIPGPTAEGYLFPDTYALHDRLEAPAVVRRMVTNWQRRIEPLRQAHGDGLKMLEGDLGWTLHEVVILASIVEKEAAVHREKATIAGVFLNRLRDPTFQPKRLQADPTVAYGCLIGASDSEACRAFDGQRVTREMLVDVGNPYNTYRHAGLPPGPIANPGLRSIRGVLAPERHEHFYFVATGDGAHRFSATLSDHNAAVDTYLRKPAAPAAQLAE